jgi:AmmeMemoRadiSam system protein B
MTSHSLSGEHAAFDGRGFSRDNVRPMAVAGLFYPQQRDQLERVLNGFMARTDTMPPACTAMHQPPKALIVPHAGYIYSGQAAADAYQFLLPWARQYKRVVMWGPAHRVAFRGVAVPSTLAFETPLGFVPVDREGVHKACGLSGVVVNDQAHAQEHSLEVQLPFLQTILGEFTLLPLVVGHIDAAHVASLMEALWGEDDTLIVVSSDLSHFHDYDTAQRRDAHTCEAVENLQEQGIDGEDACGCIALRALLRLARTRGLSVATVALCNSGDTTGDHSRVVGYGSWVFHHAAA